jgi:hypothetical protein
LLFGGFSFESGERKRGNQNCILLLFFILSSKSFIFLLFPALPQYGSGREMFPRRMIVRFKCQKKLLFFQPLNFDVVFVETLNALFMKTIFYTLFTGLLLAGAAATAQCPYRSEKLASGPGLPLDISSGLKTDSQGNFYLAGYLFGNVTFGNITLSGSYEGFLVKYSPSGQVVWAVKTGGRVMSFAVSANGEVAVTGNFSGTAVFGSQTITSTGWADFFAAKFDAGGTLQWVRTAGGPEMASGQDIVIDKDGNVIAAGGFSPSVAFPSGTLTSAGEFDIFVVKYDPNGGIVWLKSIGGSQFDEARGIVCDAGGNIFLTGGFGSSVSFGSTVLTSASMFYCGFLAKMDGNGNFLWAKQCSGSGESRGRKLCLDSSGNCILLGDFSSSIVVGGTSLSTSSPNDLFIAGYSGNGSPQWAVQTNCTGTGMNSGTFGLDITTDTDDNIYIAGYYSDSSYFGGQGLKSAGDFDVFLCSYKAAGGFRWVKAGNGPDDSYATGTASIGDRVYLSGAFMNTINFGNTNLSNSGNAIFISEYDSAGSCLTSSVAKLLPASELVFAPNPFRDHCVINAGKVSAELGQLSLSLFDVTGREVKRTAVLPGSSHKLSREGLASGVYLCRLTGRDGLLVHQTKLIIY